MTFDPDGPGCGEGLFGLEGPVEDALVQVVAVPWEATASFRRGTKGAPGAVFEASHQVDLHDLTFGDVWKHGVAMWPMDGRVEAWGASVEADALEVIESWGEAPAAAARVDAVADQLRVWVRSRCQEIRGRGAIPVVLGGDHSVPMGAIEAAVEAHRGLGVLHIDAHADLREAYLGFKWSHASVFHNALELDGLSALVGVGYRDLAVAEAKRITDDGRITAFFDHLVARRLASGELWPTICAEIVGHLPDEVYISLDIDGLEPSLCPETGTPVPGGISFHQLDMLLETVAKHRTIVGADLCEVGAGQWDAIVGSRVLYKLAGAIAMSREDPTRYEEGLRVRENEST